MFLYLSIGVESFTEGLPQQMDYHAALHHHPGMYFFPVYFQFQYCILTVLIVNFPVFENVLMPLFSIFSPLPHPFFTVIFFLTFSFACNNRKCARGLSRQKKTIWCYREWLNGEIRGRCVHIFFCIVFVCSCQLCFSLIPLHCFQDYSIHLINAILINSLYCTRVCGRAWR